MHIKIITEEWVTHRGRGEGQLFPLSEHCSPLSTATFLVPPKNFTALVPYISHSPLDKSSERALVLRSETGYQEFSGNKVQLLKFFFVHMCFKREKIREAQQPGYELFGELSNPNHLHLQNNVFP